MEAEGDSERPEGIEYLSVHCDISPLVLGSPSEVQQVPVHRFLQTANTSWNSLWQHWLPDFACHPVQGGLCCNEEFENALAETQHETHHNGAGSLWIEMLVQGEVVATTRAAARPGHLLRRRGREKERLRDGGRKRMRNDREMREKKERTCRDKAIPSEGGTVSERRKG